MSDPCPCCSGVSYEKCCAPLHTLRAAKTALELMRSRYSAYALRLKPYLLSTWHPSTRPVELRLDKRTKWKKLEILAVDQVGLHAATVAFAAHYTLSGKAEILHENSYFMRDMERWFYVGAQKT